MIYSTKEQELWFLLSFFAIMIDSLAANLTTRKYRRTMTVTES